MAIFCDASIFFGWLTITIDADGKTIRSLRKIECTFASRILSIYLYRKSSSQPNKTQTRNKTKNSSKVKIVEVESSCYGFLYEL